MSKIFQISNLPKRVKLPLRGLKIKGDTSSKGKSESLIEKEICAWLTENRMKFWKIKIKGDPMVISKSKSKSKFIEKVIIFKKNKNAGFSDIHVCYKGLALYLEVKKCGGIASEEQVQQQCEVRKAGGIYDFVTSVNEVKEIFKKLEKKNDIFLGLNIAG